MIEQDDDPRDPYDLARFVRAQQGVYEQALAEIRSGRKRTHWMWFVFPQFDGLGSSPTARRYAIRTPEEARAYLDHPILGPRLHECVEAALQVEGRSVAEVFGFPDELKLRSCATSFGSLLPAGSPFDRLLQKYFPDGPDSKTLQLVMTKTGISEQVTHRWYARPVLFVADVHRSLRFYVDVLGFEKAWHEGDGAGTVCQVNRSECEIILCQDTARTGKARLFVELTPDGLAELRREIVERSIPCENSWWGYDVIKVVDPDGNELLFPVSG